MSFEDNWLIAPPIALITADRASDQRPTSTDRAPMICKCRAIIELIICDDRSISADQLINSPDTCQSDAYYCMPLLQHHRRWHHHHRPCTNIHPTFERGNTIASLFSWSSNPDHQDPVGRSDGIEYDGWEVTLMTLHIRVKANGSVSSMLTTVQLLIRKTIWKRNPDQLLMFGANRPVGQARVIKSVRWYRYHCWFCK